MSKNFDETVRLQSEKREKWLLPKSLRESAKEFEVEGKMEERTAI